MLIKTFGFGLGFLLLLLVGMMLPTPPRIQDSMVFAKVQKDSLLEHVPGPRLIIVGGSNASYGIDSRMLQEGLGLNPVNTAVTYELGLVYMMESVAPYVREGDVVVLSPEYQHFYGNFAYGQKFLLYSAMDVDHLSPWDLSWEQWRNIYSSVPRYALSRFLPTEYRRRNMDDIVSRHAFNTYGDVDVHWDREPQHFAPFRQISREEMNRSVVKDLQAFAKHVESVGAHLYLTYPGTEERSFNNCRAEIMAVADLLEGTGIPILGTPERYIMPDSVMFNFPYHMVRPGVELRTQRLIEDLSPYVLPTSDSSARVAAHNP
ncbi:MAG: hypothetical protein D6722_20725 [Bacteroidetes bacterium]|nr:MAG: hypothetical protein D6722_20725 [Bacteroidota bacterium]